MSWRSPNIVGNHIFGCGIRTRNLLLCWPNCGGMSQSFFAKFSVGRELVSMLFTKTLAGLGRSAWSGLADAVVARAPIRGRPTEVLSTTRIMIGFRGYVSRGGCKPSLCVRLPFYRLLAAPNFKSRARCEKAIPCLVAFGLSASCLCAALPTGRRPIPALPTSPRQYVPAVAEAKCPPSLSVMVSPAVNKQCEDPWHYQVGMDTAGTITPAAVTPGALRARSVSAPTIWD